MIRSHTACIQTWSIPYIRFATRTSAALLSKVEWHLKYSFPSSCTRVQLFPLEASPHKAIFVFQTHTCFYSCPHNYKYIHSEHQLFSFLAIKLEESCSFSLWHAGHNRNVSIQFFCDTESYIKVFAGVTTVCMLQCE